MRELAFYSDIEITFPMQIKIKILYDRYHEIPSLHIEKRMSWPWSYGSLIYNYLCNRWLSPLMLWVRISTRARCTMLCDKVCQWLTTSRWLTPCPPTIKLTATI